MPCPSGTSGLRAPPVPIEPPLSPALGSQRRPRAAADTTTFLSGDTREDTRSLGVLLDTIARVSASRDLETLLDYVVDSSVQATGAERGFLVLIDEKSGKQVVRVARALSPAGEPGSIGRDSQYSTSVVKRVVDRQEPIRTSVQKDSEELDLGNSVFDLKLRAVMCVPLTTRGSEGGAGPSSDGSTVGALPKGTLYVDSRAATRDFKPEDLALFHALAQHIAIALENAQLNLHSIERGPDWSARSRSQLRSNRGSCRSLRLSRTASTSSVGIAAPSTPLETSTTS